MAEVDVNIAPLVINDFTNCKSELKFFEAAAVETTTIASPNYSFKKAITDGKNGFLAKPEEWYQKLEYLYNHPEENRKIALEAKKYALKHYYGEEFLKEVEETYDYFAK
jgi:glycosyltransferase involved in cell wall biosynthesis